MRPPQCPTEAETLAAVSGRLLCFACCLGGERAAPLALPLSCFHRSSVFKPGREKGEGGVSGLFKARGLLEGLVYVGIIGITVHTAR